LWHNLGDGSPRHPQLRPRPLGPRPAAIAVDRRLSVRFSAIRDGL